MTPTLKYLLGLALLFAVAYHSVYFKKLDAHKASAAKDFDAKGFARSYFNTRLVPSLDKAPEIQQLISQLRTDKDNTFDRYSHALGIGNIRFFLAKGEGIVTAVNENDVQLEVGADSSRQEIHLATAFVFGNAIRDAAGAIDINTFRNTMDFNNVSAELNQIVRTEILPAVTASVKKGQRVRFAGALELNRAHLNLQQLELVPVALTILP